MKKGTKEHKKQTRIIKEKNKQERRNRKRIKEIKKRKQDEQKAFQKEIKKQKKIENEIQKKKIKRKLNPKELKRIKRLKKIIKTALIVGIIFIVLLLLALSPIFNIADIQVVNNNKVSKEEIVSLLKIGKDTNIFSTSKNDIKEKLKQNAYINTEKTEIRRLLPSTLKISIKEREVQYLLEFGSSYAYVDKTGVILEISTENLSDKVKILGYATSEELIKPGNKLCQGDIDKLSDINQIVQATQNFGIYEKVTSINIKDGDDYKLYLQEEQKNVHLGNTSSMDTKMLYVKKILEKEKEYAGEIFVNVDLNTKNPYFKQNI